MYSPAKQELLEQLDIPTRTVRFYVIAPQQPGSFLIRNGLYDPVTITSLEYDRSKFELITELVDLDPRTSKRIYFNYIGQEKEYNQTEVLRVTLKHGNQKEKFELPIVYNHFDATTRWLIQQGRVPVPNPNQ
jgi:hypothetical protein